MHTHKFLRQLNGKVSLFLLAIANDPLPCCTALSGVRSVTDIKRSLAGNRYKRVVNQSPKFLNTYDLLQDEEVYSATNNLIVSVNMLFSRRVSYDRFRHYIPTYFFHSQSEKGY